jgi:hypothetical protein
MALPRRVFIYVAVAEERRPFFPKLPPRKARRMLRQDKKKGTKG